MRKELKLGFIFVILVYLTICAYSNSSNGETVIPEENNIYASLPNCEIISIAQSGNIAKIEDVIKSGADINCQNKFGKTALMIAAANNPDAVALLLDYKADANLVDLNGYTALMDAEEQSNISSMRYLIEAGADLEKKERGMGYTVLMSACSIAGKQEIVKLLLESGANPDAKDFNGQTALMLDIQRGGNYIDLLIKHGANINEREESGHTPLMFAAEYSDMKTINTILSYKPELNQLKPDGENALFFATMNKNTEVIEVLIKAGVNINTLNKDGWNALLYAAICQKQTAVKKLAASGLSVNSTDNEGRTFFSLMSLKNRDYKKVINEFIKLGADINKCDKYGMSPLMLAVAHSNPDAFELLVNNGADVSLKDLHGYDFVDYLALSSDSEAVEKIIKFTEQKNLISQDRIAQLQAALKKNNQIVADFNIIEVNLPNIVVAPARIPDVNEILLQIPDINKQDEEGKTFLMYMCEQGCDIETVKAIIKAGININIKDNEDQTALMLAAKACSPQIVQFLIDSGADIKAVGKDKMNLLMYACQNPDANVTSMFIKSFDINAVDKDSWTALMFAARHGCVETVKYLINTGANVNATSTKGCDALLGAIEQDNIEIMKLLINAGVNVTSKRMAGSADPIIWAASWSQKKETVIFLVDQISKTEKPDKYIYAALDSALFNFNNTIVSKEVLDCLKDVAAKTDSKQYKKSLTNNLAMRLRSTISVAEMQELIDEGADPNGTDKLGTTVLINAVCNKKNEIIQAILKYDVDIDAVSGKNKYTALHYAVASNYIEIAKILVEAGADIKNKEIYGNLTVVTLGNLNNAEMIQLLQNYDLYNPNDNEKAFVEAASKDKLSVVKQMISTGVSKETLSKALLTAAGERSIKFEMIQELVNAGADVNAKFDAPTLWTVLMLLCGDSSTTPEAIQFLVDKGADVNAKANGKHTALLAASGEGTPEIVKILVNAGANMEDKNFRDQTPLLMTIENHKLQNFDMLVSLGAKIDESNSYALLSKAFFGYSKNKNETLPKLLSAGVNINAVNDKGQSILMALCQHSDDVSLIQFVLDNGADATMLDPKGHDAQFYLQKNTRLKDKDILINNIKNKQ